MIEINEELIQELFNEAVVNPRKRQSYDLRTSEDDCSQRMLNTLMPGTEIAIHRHPNSNENVICLCGKIIEILFEEVKPLPCPTGADTTKLELTEKCRYILDPKNGKYGCIVPIGTWHTVKVLEPSVIYEAKDGKYGQDGSETWK